MEQNRYIMTQQDKDLLLRDLCARLPYGVYIRVEEISIPDKRETITEGFVGRYIEDKIHNILHDISRSKLGSLRILSRSINPG